MKTAMLTCLFALITVTTAFAQETNTPDTISEKQLGNIMDIIKIDSNHLLEEAGKTACKCIDSIRLAARSKNDVTDDIATCIDKETSVFQISMELFYSMSGSNKNIIINTDKNSAKYKHYYNKLEYWLMDNCKSIKNAVASDNEVSEFAYSKNEKALDAFNKGADYLNKDEFKKALPYFEKAVKIDSKFIFAWDNIGVCNRNLGNYAEAIDAYKKSLAINPKGKTPLQNIGVVYEYMKLYDEALKAYDSMHIVYPNDPESYYGAGRIYTIFKVDYEKALQNMCKAYTIYSQLHSPYRQDAQKNMQYIYTQLKEQGKEEVFIRILKENNIEIK